jgi:transposase
MTNRDKHPDFGIYAAALMALEMFEIASRRTGRTTMVIEDLNDGDLFLTVNPQHAAQVERQLYAMHGRHIGVTVSHVSSMDELYERANRVRATHPRRRILLDHSVVHRVYREAIENTAKSLAHLTGTPPASREMGSLEFPPEGRPAKRRGRV